MKDASEEETREFITDLPATDDDAEQTRGGTDNLPFAGQTIRLRIATTNNQGLL